MCGIVCGMAREDLHFRLRIPESLKRHVAEAAERNGHSMTAEIIERLGWTFNNEMYHTHGPRAASVADDEHYPPNIDLRASLLMQLESEREMLELFERTKDASFPSDPASNEYTAAMFRARIRLLEAKLADLGGSSSEIPRQV